MQHSGDAHGDEPPPPVEHIDLGARDRRPDPRWPVRGRRRLHLARGRHHRALRRAIVVDEPRCGVDSRPHRQPVAPGEQCPHPLQPGAPIAEELLDDGRRQEADRHPPLAEPARQPADIAAHVVSAGGDARPCGQVRPQLPDRGVEAERRQPGAAILGRHPEVAAVPAHQVAERAVLDHDALGCAGGAGGVDDVGEVHGGGPRLGIGRRASRRLVAVEEDGAAMLGQAGEQRGVGEEHRRGAVLEQQPQPLRRVLGVEGHVRPARLEDREQPHHQLRRALRADPDEHLRAHPEAAQVVRQPVRPTVQLRIRQRVLSAHHRGRLRGARRPLLDELVDGAVGGDLRIGRVPLHEQAVALLLGEQVERTDLLLRRRRHLHQQPLEVAEQPLHRLRLEPARVVGRAQAQLGTRLGHQRQRVVGPVLHPDQLQLRPRPLPHRVVLVHEQGVEERRARRQPAPPLHLGERRVLVRTHRHLGRLQLAQPGGDLALLVHPHPHRHRGDEQPHHRLHPGELRRAARHGHPEDDVRAPRVPAQQHPPGALQDRAHRQMTRPGQLLQAPGRRRVQPPGLGPHLPLSGAVGEQPGRPLQPRQLGAPPLLVRGAVPTLQPGDVVAVRAHRQQPRRLPPRQRRGPGAHLLEHDRQAPAVEEQVVEGPHQPPLLARPVQNRQPQQRRLAQREPPTPVLREELLEPLLAGAAVVLHRHLHPTLHHLERTLHPLPHHPAAQDRVALHHLRPRSLEQCGVHPGSEPEAVLLDVLPRPRRVQAVEQDPLLHRRQRVDVLERQV